MSEEFLRKAEIIVKDLNNIVEKRKYLYDNAPYKPNTKIEISKERCEHEGCPLDHIVINITTDFMLADEILNIFRYLKRNNLAAFYRNNIFHIVLN